MGNPVPNSESTSFQANYGLNLSDVSGLLATNVSGVTASYTSGVVAGTITISGSALFDGSITIGGAASGIVFSGLQMLPSVSPTSYVIWVSGSTYRAATTFNGQVVASGTDPETIFQTVIQNVKSAGIGAGVVVKAGTYNFQSGTAMYFSGGAPVRLMGEGGGLNGGTILNFAPASGTLLSGCIVIKQFDTEIEHMRIKGNSGVSRGIIIVGNAQHGKIHHCYIEGQSGGNTWVSGNVGLIFDNSVAATYSWKVHDNFFNSWETAISMSGSSNTNAQHIDNCNFDNTMIAIHMNSTLNMVSNIFHQGSAGTDRSGGCTLFFGPDSFANSCTNIITEQFSGLNCYGVILKSGSNSNGVFNIKNSQGQQWLTYDENPSAGSNRVIETNQNIQGNNIFRSGSVTFEGSVVLGSGSSGFTFNGLQMLPTFGPASYTFWVSGTTYRSMNTATGLIQFSGTDPVVVFQNTVGQMNGSGIGGVIGFKRGIYTFTSGVMISGEGTITLMGEGGGLRSAGTQLVFNPGSNLLSGAMVVRNDGFGLENIRLTGTSGVSLLMNIIGNAQRGHIDHCYIDGASGGSRWVSGTVGIHFDNSVAAVYYWKISNNFFNFFERGIWCDGSTNTNAQLITNCNFDNTMFPLELDCTLCTISNIFHQGHSEVQGDRSGGATIRFLTNSFANRASNITAEQFSGANCSIIVFMSGANNNAVEGVVNGQIGAAIVDYNVSGGNFYNRITPGRLENAPILMSGSANPFDYYNDTGKLQMVSVNGGSGTVNGISIISNSTQFNTSGTQGTFAIHPGQTIRVAYTGAPRIYRQDV